MWLNSYVTGKKECFITLLQASKSFSPNVGGGKVSVTGSSAGRNGWGLSREKRQEDAQSSSEAEVTAPTSHCLQEGLSDRNTKEWMHCQHFCILLFRRPKKSEWQAESPGGEKQLLATQIRGLRVGRNMGESSRHASRCPGCGKMSERGPTPACLQMDVPWGLKRTDGWDQQSAGSHLRASEPGSMTAEMETDLSGTPGGAQLRDQEAEVWGGGEWGWDRLCRDLYREEKAAGFCILGQFWGLRLRGLCQKMGTKGQGQPEAVHVGSQTLEQGVLKIFLVFATWNET